ncbi:D-cysteine desulfhydrase family protein [Pandoraea anhela]|uniref:D-cysteine desulfhydrase n=1 Tax=Pandoraea anhela TaxID=2508295 RepID=A0A5E4WQD7_9BURK|nr:D-cysteine desulfhydrase family protein [Pandoraea anhela]VVE26433.1 D-cysteine desulfhydrase [Pandoraea anhela]
MTSVLKSAFERHARVALMQQPTPIARLTRLESLSGAQTRGIRLFVKRDDLGEVGGGGNKLRKLEFLLGYALAERVDTVITLGGIQSNHARLTAAACANLGLTCELVLADMVPRHDAEYREGGNVMLDRLFGAKLTFLSPGSDARSVAAARAEALRARGHRPMVIPAGGSSALGALGYVKCAQEILDYEAAHGVVFRHVVVPNGSHGTQAGLVAGFARAAGRGGIVRAYSVLSDRETTYVNTVNLVRETLALLDADASDLKEDVDIVVQGDYRGQAYGLPTPAMVDAVRLLARSEGILLDPVYSGKAFSGLLGDLANDRLPPNSDILFVATGGTPSLFAYRDTFDGCDQA